MLAVIRVNKTADYTVMSNAHLKEKGMSLKAKGLLSLMLSLPDSWDYSIAGLCAICKENETAIKSTLSELKLFGYLIITKKKPNETASGRFEYEYNIYEKPQRQVLEKQGIENLPLENQAVENPAQLNTNLSSIKKSKIKESNIDIYNAIIDHLNKKANMKYRASSKATQGHINARLAEGYTIEDFKTVIDKKVLEWRGTAMEKYLRPETLFGSKFENYLNAPVTISTPTPTRNGSIVTVNGKEYEYRNGKYYIPNGSNIAVDINNTSNDLDGVFK